MRPHQQMIVWQMIDKLDYLVQKILRKIPAHEFKIKSQIDSASDSMGANFVEGYYSGSLLEYIRFLRYSRRSGAELQDRVRRLLRKGYLNLEEYELFSEISNKTNYLLDKLIESLKKKEPF